MTVKLFVALLVVGVIAAKSEAALKATDLSPFTDKRSLDDPEILEQCIAFAKSNCGVPQSFDIFDLSMAEIIETVNDTDLHDICSGIPTWLTCISDIMQTGVCRKAIMKNPQVSRAVYFQLSLLRLVCVTRVNELNEAKSCLLEIGAGSDDQLLILHQIEQFCSPELQKALSFLKNHGLAGYCIASIPDLMECASLVVEQQCGADIAESTVPAILSIARKVCV